MWAYNFFWFVLLIIVFSFFCSLGSFINLLIIMENYNVLLLFFCIILEGGEGHMIFLSVLVIMTLEVAFGLVLLCRMWNNSFLDHIATA